MLWRNLPWAKKAKRNADNNENVEYLSVIHFDIWEVFFISWFLISQLFTAVQNASEN